jgi:hypothetical protein
MHHHFWGFGFGHLIVAVIAVLVILALLKYILSR